MPNILRESDKRPGWEIPNDTLTIHNVTTFTPEDQLRFAQRYKNYIKTDARQGQQGAYKYYGSDVSHIVPQFLLQSATGSSGWGALNTGFYPNDNNRRGAEAAKDIQMRNYLEMTRANRLGNATYETYTNPKVENGRLVRYGGQPIADTRYFKFSNDNPDSTKYFVATGDRTGGLYKMSKSDFYNSINKISNNYPAYMFNYGGNNATGEYILGRDYAPSPMNEEVKKQIQKMNDKTKGF